MRSSPLLEKLASGGLFVPDSPLGSLHPSVKLIVPLVLCTGLIAGSSLPVLFFTFCLLTVPFIGTGAKDLVRAIRSSLPFLALVVLIRVLFIPVAAGNEYELWGFTATSGTLKAAGVSALRLLDFVLAINLAGRITDADDIVTGTRVLLKPFSRFGVPADGAALTLTILFRFIPVLARESVRLMRAQAARGADFAERSRNPVKRVTAFLPLLVPLFLSALRRSETLILAMEARGFPGKTGGRVRNAGRPGWKDFAVLGALAVWTAAVFSSA